jgi:ankyrin repeat protein
MSTRRATNVSVSQVPHILKGVRIQLPLSTMTLKNRHSAPVNTNANSDICTFGEISEAERIHYEQVEERLRGELSLRQAASLGNLNTCWRLIGNGVNVNAKEASTGETPLHYAAFWGRANVVRALLEAGARVDVVSEQGRTPLHHAAERGHADVAQALLDKDASVDPVDEEGDTPLHVAALEGHANVARALLEAGASVGAVGKEGDTPLHYAALEGHADVARALLDKGASVDAVDTNGDTPLLLAEKQGHADVARALLEAGASMDDP